MEGRVFLVSLLVVSGILLAGCSGTQDTPTTTEVTTTATPTTTQTATTQSRPIPAEEAKRLTFTAEKERVRQVLENMTNLTDVSVGVYGNTNATVVNWTEVGATVRVKMSYSYGYDCNGRAGHVDGLNTNALYHASADETSLIKIEKRVKNACQ